MGAFGFYIDSDGFSAEVSVSRYVVPGFDGFPAVVGEERLKRAPGLRGGLIWFECDNVINDAAGNAFPRAGE